MKVLEIVANSKLGKEWHTTNCPRELRARKVYTSCISRLHKGTCRDCVSKSPQFIFEAMEKKKLGGSL